MKIAIIGECMVELSQQAGNQYKMGYGGDTLNTAIYLARCGGASDYFTVLSDDSYSKNMLSQWQSEGVGINHVKINPNSMPGLYIIENDVRGERSFHYWRQHSPARTLLSDFPNVLAQLQQYSMIFLSGITLSLYSSADLSTLFNFLAGYRKNGGLVVFDNNYRQRNWPSIEQAHEYFAIMARHTDIALLSFDDEVSLYGSHSVEQCINRWQEAGASEVVVKNGHHGCALFQSQNQNKKITQIPLKKVVKPVDTTAAGDSFNGAYLAAKLQGESTEEAIAQAQICASIVIMYKGAIIEPYISLKEAL